MDIYGQFGRFIKRNEKTGESRFSVMLSVAPHKYAICEGTVQDYPRFIPLKLTGEWELQGEKEVFNAVSVSAFGYDTLSMGRFLYSKAFTDIGLTGAKRIMEGCGTDDLFGMLAKTKDLKSIAAKIDFPEGATIKALEKLKSFTEFEKFFEYIKDLGGDYYNAMLLFDKYGMESMNALSNNPYILLYSGTPLKICESLAKESGMEHCDRKRMKAIVAYCMDRNSKNGNTRISFHRLCCLVHSAEKAAGGYYISNPLFIAEEMLEDRYHTEEEGDDFYIYKKEDYEAETAIADNIARLNRSAVERIRENIAIDDVEGICGTEYSDDQKAAFKVLEKSGIKIITGGPGTGKTTVLKGLLYKYEADSLGTKKIALCAPTGCAARRMSECTGRPASTIHKLLGIRPYEDISKTPAEKLDADFLVVDESSMIDAAVMARLLGSVRNGTTVLLTGDKDQLPSVGAGNVLEDILQSHAVETYHLHSVFRQDGRSLIIENSRKIIKGDARLKTGPMFTIKEYDSEEKLIDGIAGLCREHINEEGMKLYSPSKNKKFKTGTIRLNAVIQGFHHREDGISISFGPYTFRRGDTVMFTRNDYEKGYYNGQEGVVRDIQDHNGRICVCIEADGDRISLSGKELADIELAYAITAHKSQGGECRNAVIVVPSEPSGMLKRQLLYVEVTRARENVILMCEKGALSQAISRKGTIYRETGLSKRLNKQEKERT